MVALPNTLHVSTLACEFRSDDGLMLRGEHCDVGRGRPLLLAHGFGQTRQAWSATQQRLAANGYTSLSWDARGHGQSGRNPAHRPYRAEQFVADVVHAAQATGAAPVLVGASMGGLTGLIAQQRARPFSALVLVDIAPRWEPTGVARILDFMGAHPDGFDSYTHASEEIARYLPHRRERKGEAQLRHLLRAGVDGRLRWHWDPRLLAEFIPDTRGIETLLDDAARSLDVPTLLISGGRSDLVSHDHVAHFLDLVPHARHVRLPDATHMLAGDDNDAFTETLLNFLSDPALRAGRLPE
ncbi:MAG TPA: alpha/beta fold hydrolase [Arenimonas sp.]|nr:alpha/beta fold hydrolase [Arenimonas sp.]